MTTHIGLQGVIIKQKTDTALLVMFALLFISTVLGGTVSTLMSVYLPVAARELLGAKGVADLNRVSAYISATFILGWAIGGFTWGLISDTIGRKKAILLAITCFGLATSFTGLTSTWEAVMVCRFFSGFGIGGLLVVSFTLMSELWPARNRSVFTGILSIAIPVGIFSAGLVNYIVADWRRGFFIGVAPLLLALIGLNVIPESPVWQQQQLQSNGRKASARQLFAGDNRKDLLAGSLIFGTMLIGLWAIFSWLPTWVQSLISSGDAQKERGISMMLLGMGGLTGGFISGWIANAIGLRRAMLTCFTACAVLSFVLFKTNTSFHPVIYIEIGLLALFFGISQGILSAYIPQLFPPANRATATGFCFNIGRLFTATAVLFVGVLVETLGGYGNALLLFSLVFFIGLIGMIAFKQNLVTRQLPSIS